MNFSEEVVIFPVAGEELLGIVAKPEFPADHGVLIIVGGPQYRVGSHRQFLLLSRQLASEGHPSLRFDCRGMGDSGGAMRGFEETSEDIGAAISAFQLACPSVKCIILWGLCDAASAALLYFHTTRDLRVVGMALLNPWVRSEASLAQTQIKHYYRQRLLQREFWAKLFNGEMHLLKSLRDLLKNVIQARGRPIPSAGSSCPFQGQMAKGLRQFSGEVLLILSGQDYTAKEFLQFVRSNDAWSGLVDATNVRRIDIETADHTFSSKTLRLSVESATLTWLADLLSARRKV